MADIRPWGLAPVAMPRSMAEIHLKRASIEHQASRAWHHAATAIAQSLTRLYDMRRHEVLKS